MKSILLSVIAVLIAKILLSQGTYCNMNGNLMIFSNYDGGALNINVDVNIPNLKIGVVSYEATTINLSGAYVSNVTGVVYAGYSGTNNHCGTGTTTSINGAPTNATKTILNYPAVTLTNSNGYPFIICAYSCSINTSQGGCNTIDQVEAFMLNYFSNSVLYAHRVQYGCWLNSQSVSAGGNCCASITSLTLSSRIVDESCSGNCDGSVAAGAAGGNPPYTYTLNGTSVFNNLCAGSYVVRVVDGISNFKTDTVDVNSGGPAAPTGDSIQEFCGTSEVADLIAVGGLITWYDSDTSSSPLSATDQLVNGKSYYASASIGVCESHDRLRVTAIIRAGNLGLSLFQNTITASATGVLFQWINCATMQAVAGANSRTFSPVINGLYAVVITDGSCSDTSQCVSVQNVGIEAGHAQKSFVIRPNPSNGRIYIQADCEIYATLEVFSIQGALLKSFQLTTGGDEAAIETGLDNGLYLARLRGKDILSDFIRFQITK